MIFIFWVALSIEGERISERLLVLCCDFWAVYLLIFESVAIPHNTMVLFGSYGIVLSSKMFVIQEIAWLLLKHNYLCSAIPIIKPIKRKRIEYIIHLIFNLSKSLLVVFCIFSIDLPID